MTLEKAIELVVADTRENTDPNFTINQAIACARELTILDIQEQVADGILEKELAMAYAAVIKADQSRIDYCLGLI